MAKFTNTGPIQVDQLAERMMGFMHEYVDLADESMKKAVKKTAKAVKKEIAAEAPKRTGEYAKSWTTKVIDVKSHRISAIVYQKQKGGQWRLAHLLEEGHDYTNPDTLERTKNAAKPHEHIRPARGHGGQLLVDLIKKELSK